MWEKAIGKVIKLKLVYGEILLDQSTARAMVIDGGAWGQHLEQAHCQRFVGEPSHHGKTFAQRRCGEAAQNRTEEGGGVL